MGFLVRVVVNGAALWAAAAVLPGFYVLGVSSGWATFGLFLLTGLVFGLVNAIVKPLVQLLSLPLYILTLGLFTLVVNALMLLLTTSLTSSATWGLQVEGFGTAVLAAIIISVVSFFLSALMRRSQD